MASKIAGIFSQPNDKKLAAYTAVAAELLTAKDCKGIKALVQHLVQKEGADQHGRTYITPDVLLFLINTLKSTEDEAKQIDFEELIATMEDVVPMIREKGEDFPNPLLEAVDFLAQLYMGDENWKKAAFMLTSFKFETYRHCTASAERKVEWFVNTAETWLEADETGMASQAVNKAHSLMQSVKDVKLTLRFRTCYARVLDAERKFLEAAMQYKKLSQLGQAVITEEDMLLTLQNAVTCAILAKAGPSRSRVLAMLYADERSASLTNYLLLEKMFKDRIVRDLEVKSFEQTLQTHQNAATANGMTVLQNSMAEHNLLAASKLYSNIKFAQLGVLLGVSGKEAEKLASDMIEQGRMEAVIDQIEEQLEFNTSGTDSLNIWDQQIQDLCLTVNHVVDDISKKYPKYVF